MRGRGRIAASRAAAPSSVVAASWSAAAAPESAAAASESPGAGGGGGTLLWDVRFARVVSAAGGVLGKRRLDPGAACKVESDLCGVTAAGTARGGVALGGDCVMGNKSEERKRARKGTEGAGPRLFRHALGRASLKSNACATLESFPFRAIVVSRRPVIAGAAVRSVIGPSCTTRD